MTVPCAPPSIRNATGVDAADPRLDVLILPGIKQLTPPDVMRGEETQIAGFLADNQNYTGTLCLPGTHTKWVALKDGRIERFRTFMTGETFALLSKHLSCGTAFPPMTSTAQPLPKRPNTVSMPLKR